MLLQKMEEGEVVNEVVVEAVIENCIKVAVGNAVEAAIRGNGEDERTMPKAACVNGVLKTRLKIRIASKTDCPRRRSPS